MNKAWKSIDLGGEGLQSANVQLARALRRRRTAYLLWLAFPLGAHRAYLREPVGTWLYRGLSVAALAALAFDARIGAALGALLAGFALADLFWIGRRLVALNKRLRMQAYLRPAPGVPAGFRGRYRDDDDEASTPPRAPSFAEQERLLAELERRRCAAKE
ncbi:MAG: TM2 domain-containing protein [Betaproteobacteria bacterium]|nr:TM2 domain-containing protein [Betaproteobacteria bacterium]